MRSFVFTQVLLFLFASTVKGELCNCINYLISEGGLSNENEITSIPFDLEEVICDGDGVSECKKFCTDMYEELTDSGDLCSIMPGDTKNVGDWMCQALKRNVCDVRVGIFVKTCGSDAVDTGFRFKNSICCSNGRHTLC